MVAKAKDIVETPIQNAEILSAYSFPTKESYDF